MTSFFLNQIFGYTRDSTADQNLDTQLETLSKINCDKIFQEEITRTSASRPALDEILALLRKGDTVVVARLSRLGRSGDHLISLINDFAGNGIEFKAFGY